MNINVASGYRSARRRAGNHRSRVSSLRGFTLIELMIVVAVLAIVMTIAIASYGSATMKTRRGAAQGCLTEAAQFMERYYTTNMTYAGADFSGSLACVVEQGEFYGFSFNGVPDGDEYEVQATPEGAQAGDTLCGTMSLNQFGVKTESGSAAEAGDCW